MDEKEYPNKETEELFEGVENGDDEVVKALLLGNKNKQFELDINFQFKYKKDGKTVLHCAAEKGFEEIVKILIEHGSNVHLQSKDGWTALHLAAFYGSEQIVEILIEHRSNINLQTKGGKTVLDVAKDQNIAELIIQLKGRTIKPAQSTKKGN